MLWASCVVISGRLLGVLLFNKKTVLLCFGVLLYSGCYYVGGVVIRERLSQSVLLCCQ